MDNDNRGHLNAAEAWRTSLIELNERGSEVVGVQDSTSVGSDFGIRVRNTIELIGFGFSINSPRRRLIVSETRRLNARFAIANAVWSLTGANDLRTIEFFNSRARRFSDDGETLFAAPGYRIFSSPSGNLLAEAVEKLQSDPTSRRAIIQIARPEDLLSKNRDISCTIALQFLIRDGRLSCVTHMRSQSALMVLPYDIFLFTMIQEAAALVLGCELGPYFHSCGSFHYYLDEADIVKKVIGSELGPQPEMPPMTSFDDQVRGKLSTALANISNKESGTENIDFGAFGLDEYWTDLLRLMSP